MTEKESRKAAKKDQRWVKSAAVQAAAADLARDRAGYEATLAREAEAAAFVAWLAGE